MTSCLRNAPCDAPSDAPCDGFRVRVRVCAQAFHPSTRTTVPPVHPRTSVVEMNHSSRHVPAVHRVIHRRRAKSEDGAMMTVDVWVLVGACLVAVVAICWAAGDDER